MSFPVEKIVPEWALNLLETTSDEENNGMSDNQEDKHKIKRRRTMLDFFTKETFTSTNNNNRNKSNNTHPGLRDITNVKVIHKSISAKNGKLVTL